MNLFEMKDFKLQINPAAYTLTPFRKIWDRDKSRGKKKALLELAYIYYMCDYKSDYSDIVNTDEKHNAIISGCFEGKDFKPDKAVEDAMEFYESRQETLMMRMYKVAKLGIAKMETYVKEINLDERDAKTQKPVHNVTHLKGIIKELAEMADNVEKLEKKARAELQQTESNTKGNKEKSVFEDGI